jgi:hypothetical protein
MSRASRRPEWLAALALAGLTLLPRPGVAQPGSETERKRREIEQQLRLPKTAKPPAPAPAEPEPAAEAPAPAPGTPPGTPAALAPPPPFFQPEIHGLMMTTCRMCHAPGAPAGGSKLILRGEARADYDTVRAFADVRRPRASLLITKASGQMHGGGPTAPAGSRVQRRLLAWITAGTPFDAASNAAGAVVPPSPPRPPGRAVPRPAIAAAPPAPIPVPVPVPQLPPAGAPPAPPEPAAPRSGPPAGPDFATAVEPVLLGGCRACHNPLGPAAASRLHISGDVAVDYPMVAAFTVVARPAESPLVTKASGVMHGGGPILPTGSDGQRILLAWIGAGAPGPVVAAPASPESPATVAGPPAAPVPTVLPPPGTPAAPLAPHPHGDGGVALPLGLRLDGRFDLNYERRGLGRDTSFGDGKNVLRSYHQFLFLSRAAESDPIGFTVEVIALQTWEAYYRHRFDGPSLTLVVRGGKILVPFGNEPLFHQAYGGLVGFDQKILPIVWAQEGVSTGLVYRRGAMSLSSDAYLVRGYRLRQADAVINLQNDFSSADDFEPSVGGRLGAAAGPFTAYYSALYNPLGFGRNLVMQAADLSLWRVRGVPILDRLVLGVGALRADVSGGGAGQDYYHFGSYWQARLYLCDWFYLQYRQGLRTFNNRRGLIVDETRLDSDDASTHTLGLVARYHGLTAGVQYFINLEKANEIDDDFLRVSVVYEF